MLEKEIHDSLIANYPEQISTMYPFPQAFKGSEKIRAIVLGADPTHIINGLPKQLNMVFGLDQDKSPYWNTISRNIKELQTINIDHIYVQNICRNYFKEETSKNKQWVKIARDFWMEHLKNELDNMFDSSIPILITTEFILKAVLNDGLKMDKAKDIYSNLLTISKEDNLLQRELIAFYRHPRYLLRNWVSYKEIIDCKLYI